MMGAEIRKPNRDWEMTNSDIEGISNGGTGARIGYARVSTTGQNLDQQEQVLRDAGCREVYGEKVSSTVPSERRQVLQQVLRTLQHGDTLVVAKLDRLGRTQSEVVARLASLNEGGIHIETLDGLLNTKALGKMAPLVVGLLTGLAEVERNLIQERTRESVEHRRRTGGNIGGRPEIHPGKKEMVLRLRTEGRTYKQIAEITEISMATAHKYARECEVA